MDYNKKSAILNKKRTARKKLIWHLKHVLNIRFGGSTPSIKTAVEIFCNHYNLVCEENPKKWLLKIYESGENEFIKRSDSGFYNTPEWKKIRKIIIDKYGYVCMKCGTEDESICVDHIKPLSKYPELKFEENNMQTLCNLCNLIKSNRDETDYRKDVNELMKSEGYK